MLFTAKKIMKAGLFKDDVKGTDALFNLISYCEKMMKIIFTAIQPKYCGTLSPNPYSQEGAKR